MKNSRFAVVLFLLLVSHTCPCQSIIVLEHVKRQPYTRYKIETKGKDSISFYLTEFDKNDSLPLIVYIQGSGNQSLFQRDSLGNIRPAGGHISLAYLVQQKAKLLIVEKPGVEYTGSAKDKTNFDRKFSLDSWTNYIVECINFIKQQEKISKNKLVLIGHSEGGLVAARLSFLLNQSVTHTAILAGEGPSQLYSLYRLAEKRIFFTAPGQEKAPADSLLYIWEKIKADPLSIEKKFWGFTYLRWSSFLKTSVYDELSKFDGKILIAQGEEDRNVFPESAKVLYAGLLSKNKSVSLIMVPGADHSFNISNSPEINGWESILKKCIDWALSK